MAAISFAQTSSGQQRSVLPRQAQDSSDRTRDGTATANADANAAIRTQATTEVEELRAKVAELERQLEELRSVSQ